MSQLIRKLTSLDNLCKAKNRSGQIATLLILFMVVGLIFVLVTLNLGNTAVSTTRMANAVDSSTLSLASSLATRSKQFGDSLIAQCGNPLKCCKKTGMASAVFAIVAAIIACIVAPYLLALLAAALPASMGAAVAAVCLSSSTALGLTTTGAMIAGGVGGAIGGAIGGAYAGTGAGAGAWQGFKLGVAVGGLAAGLYNAPAGFSSATPGASQTTSAGATGGLGGGTASTTVTTAGGATETVTTPFAFGELVPAGMKIVSGSVTYAAGGWHVLGGFASGTSGLASNYLADRGLEEEFEAVTKKLASLSSKDREREQAFFSVMTKLVDDTALLKDTGDINKNGDTEEFLPQIIIEWSRRIDALGQIKAQSNSMVEMFFQGPLKAYDDYLHTKIEGGQQTITVWWSPTPIIVNNKSMFQMQEYELFKDPATGYLDVRDGAEDSDFCNLFRGLWNMGYRITVNVDGENMYIWEPGPNATTLKTWFDETCCGDDCSPPPTGYDCLDEMYVDMFDMMQFFDAILNDPDTAIIMWEYIMGLFYNRDDPDDKGTYFGMVNTYVDILTQARTQIDAIRDSFPDCTFGYYTDPAYGYSWPDGWPQVDQSIPCTDCPPFTCPPGWSYCWGTGCLNSCFVNAPCRTVIMSGYGMSVDPDRRDEYEEYQKNLNELLARTIQFRDAIENFFNSLNSMASSTYGLYGTGLQECVSGSRNCLKYVWDDSRGANSVMIRIGDFQEAQIATHKYGDWFKGKVCQELENYTDGDKCWIEATRTTASEDMGAIGTWNPFGVRPVRKRAKADYSYDHVRLK